MPTDTSRPLAVGLVVLALVIAVVVGVLLLGDGAGTVPLGDRSTGSPIDGCTTIDEPGRYVLTADIVDAESTACIRIQSSDVRFDGDGHTVDGIGAFGTTGVFVRSPSGESLSNVSVLNVTATGWDDGIRLVGVVDARVVGATAADNRVGVSLRDVHGSRLADSEARSNRLYGISVLEVASDVTVTNNTATGNGLFGVHLVDADVRNVDVLGNTASSNEFGFGILGARDNELRDNHARSNHIAGIWLTAAVDNRLAGNRVDGGFYGVYLADTTRGTVIERNDVEGAAVGVRLRSADANEVAGNAVHGSQDTAILLIASDDNSIVDNRGSGNARGIVVVRSEGNAVANNTVA